MIFKIDLKLNLQNFKIHKVLARCTNAKIIIPVAVYFTEVDSNSPDRRFLREMAQNKIDILNDACNATNADVALWTPQVQAIYIGTN